jgi:glycosyltransferase involved in cell wall biosynthesis
MGGLELEVIKLLNRLDKKRYQCAIIATESIAPSARELVGEEIELVALNKRAGVQWQVIAQIAAFCRERKIDILHSHNWATFFYGVLGGVRGRVPVLIHGEHGRETRDYAPSFEQRLACQWLAQRCEFITAVSDDIVPLLTATWKAPLRKIVKLPVGVALDEFDFHADRNAAKRALGLPEEAFVLGAIVGTFRPVKDVPAMFRAFQIVREKNPRALLAVAGGGNLQIARQQAAECGVSAHVRFLGERRDIPRVLAAFDLYLNSSLYEGTSNAILEAMAAGVPVVATQVGGTPLIVRNGETGWLAPPSSPEAFASAIQRLIENESLREKIKNAARAYVEQRHSHEDYVRLHEKMYEECRARRASRRSCSFPSLSF